MGGGEEGNASDTDGIPSTSSAPQDTGDAQSTQDEETQEPGQADLSAEIRGNTNPTQEQIDMVNNSLNDSYLGDFYGLGSDYSAYDGRFEGVTLDIWIPNFYGAATIYPDLREHPVFKRMMELTGIDLNFIVPLSGEESTEFNLMVTGQELPDIIFNVGGYYNGGLAAAADDGLIIDMTEHEDKLPNYMQYVNNGPYSEELTRATITDDHRRLAVYELHTNDQAVSISLLIKPKAMEATGWTEPPETIDEYYQFLTDCKNAGYGIPICFGNANGFPFNGSSVIATAFGTCASTFVDENGRVQFGPAQEGLRDYLETMHQWYEEGLLDPDFAVGDSAHRTAVMTSDDNPVLVSSYSTMLNLLNGTYGEDIIAAPIPVMNKGDQPVINGTLSALAGGGASITSQCENVDAALAFLDFGFSKKGWELCATGSYGDVHLIDEEGRPYFQEDSLMRTDEDIMQSGQIYLQSKFKLHHYVCAYDDKDATVIDTDVQDKVFDVWTKNTKFIALPAGVSVTAEERSSIADIATNINTVTGEYLTNIIIGQYPLSEVETYWKTIQDMGLDDYLAVYQAAYDRYLAR